MNFYSCSFAQREILTFRSSKFHEILPKRCFQLPCKFLHRSSIPVALMPRLLLPLLTFMNNWTERAESSLISDKPDQDRKLGCWCFAITMAEGFNTYFRVPKRSSYFGSHPKTRFLPFVASFPILDILIIVANFDSYCLWDICLRAETTNWSRLWNNSNWCFITYFLKPFELHPGWDGHFKPASNVSNSAGFEPMLFVALWSHRLVIKVEKSNIISMPLERKERI